MDAENASFSLGVYREDAPVMSVNTTGDTEFRKEVLCPSAQFKGVGLEYFVFM
mgnify:CR=1 FL=1